MKFPKPQVLRSESYRRYVAGFPCFACGIEGYSQAAHDDFGRGQRQKTCDTRIFPLCCTRYMEEGCHVRFDQLKGMTLEQRRELGAQYVTRMRAQAERDGRKEAALWRNEPSSS